MMLHVKTWDQIGLGIQIYLFQNVVFTTDAPYPEGFEAALHIQPQEYFLGKRYE